MSLIRYQRTGGHRPANDELLEIESDGTFSLRRVVGGSRVGEFVGEIPVSSFKTLQKHLNDPSIEVGIPPEGQMPPFVLEYITAEGLAAEVSPEARIKNKPLASLARVLRELAEDLTAHPASAFECDIADGAPEVRLAILGEGGPVHVKDASLTFDLFGEQEEFLTGGKLDSPFPRSEPVELQPGWSTSVSLPRELNFNPKMTLQVRMTFRMKYSDGIWRDAQVSAVAGRGWF